MKTTSLSTLALTLFAIGCAPPMAQPPVDVPTVDSMTMDTPANPPVDTFVAPIDRVAPPVDSAIAEPTWHGSIAPLVARHCAECHTGGGVAPFALSTYAQAVAVHRAMAMSVGDRTMPPFNPAAGCQEFRDERRLSDAEIALIRTWSTNGAPEGAVVPPPMPTVASPLEWVDAELDIGGDFVPTGVDGPLDQWQCFGMDPRLADGRVLIGYEFVPTTRVQVHHAGFVEASAAAVRARDASEPGLGWRCSGDVGVGSGRVVGSWAGGFGAVKYPAGTGMRINPGTMLAVQIHYRIAVNGVATADRTRLRLQYARGPVAHEADYLGIGVPSVTIPPRTLGFTDSYNHTMDHDVILRAAEPHMHGLGKSIRVEIVQGDRRTCVMNIPRWNYHWEEMHFYRDDSIRIPAGATISVSCVWDNPQATMVVPGLTFENEMCDVGMLLTNP